MQAKNRLIQFLLQGKKVYFVTNNGSKSRLQYLEKLQKMGFEAYEASHKTDGSSDVCSVWGGILSSLLNFGPSFKV